MRLRPFVPALLAPLALAACEAPDPASGSARAVAGRSSNVGAAPTPAVVARPVAKALDVAEVRWPDRAAVEASIVAELAPEARAAVLRSRVPVLVPRRAELASRAVVMPSAHYTAVSVPAADRDDGITVSLQGTRVAHRYPAVPPALGRDVVRGRDAWVTQNEGIWSATWTEHGVSYVLEVECARPGEDPRCASDAFVRALAEELAFVGGDFGEGGAR